MRWTVLMLAGCVLITAWVRTLALPPLAVRESTIRPADLELRSMRAQLETAERMYQSHVRSDSLLPLLTTALGVVVSLPQLAPELRDTVGAAIEREFAAIGHPRARLGVFAVDMHYGRRTSIPMPLSHRPQLYAGADSAGPYCAVVAIGATEGDGPFRTSAFGFALTSGRMRQRPTVLGPCAFVAQYGMPGGRIHDWLRHGAYRFADLTGPAARDDREPVDLPLWSWNPDEVAIRACRGGRTDMCTSFVLAATRSPAGAATYEVTSRELFGPAAVRTLLHDVEQQFGPDRFETFWTSEADVATAFAVAFGIDLGAWVHQWTRARSTAASLGPGMDVGNLVLTVLLLVMLAVIAFGIAARREV